MRAGADPLCARAMRVPLTYAQRRHPAGYQRLNQNVTQGKADAHEGIDFYRPVENPDRHQPLWGENQWPADYMVQGFKSTYERWIDRMKELGTIVVRHGLLDCSAAYPDVLGRWRRKSTFVRRRNRAFRDRRSMAVGLGMTEDEWADLRGKVDDSFWVCQLCLMFPRVCSWYDCL